MKNMNKNYLMPKAELHCHLDGCIRTETVYHYNKIKGSIPKDITSMHEVNSHLKLIGLSDDLRDYLRPFDYATSAVKGNKEALTRIASEICFDKFNDNVRYLEIRYSPHLLMGTSLSCKDVVKIIMDSVIKTEYYLNSEANPLRAPMWHQEGEKQNAKETVAASPWPEFKAKIILCGIWGCDNWLSEVIDIIQELDPEHKHLVAIDMAGNSAEAIKNLATVKQTEDLYKKAKSLKIGRTCHAGEDGSSDTVVWAVENLHCSRVGHGYRLCEDKNAWAKYMLESHTRHSDADVNASMASVSLNEAASVHSDAAGRAESTSATGNRPKLGPHFEMCPLSSIYTNVKNMRDNHVLNELRPNIHNISLSTDNSSLHFSTLSTEYDHVENEYGWGFDDLCGGNLNALAAAFGNLDEEYIEQFRTVYASMR